MSRFFERVYDGRTFAARFWAGHLHRENPDAFYPERFSRFVEAPVIRIRRERFRKFAHAMQRWWAGERCFRADHWRMRS